MSSSDSLVNRLEVCLYQYHLLIQLELPADLPGKRLASIDVMKELNQKHKRTTIFFFLQVEVLENLMKDLEQARKKDKELFEEAKEKERKLSEEKVETFKEEMIKDTNEKLAEVLTQLKEQPYTPHSA